MSGRPVAPALHRRPLGRLGLMVTSIGLGTGSFPATNEPDVIRRHAAVVRAALVGGINLVDCSSNYAHGAAEAVVGCVLAELLEEGAISRSDVIVCSKGGYGDGSDQHSLAPEFIRRELQASLRRLQLDRIDLYFLHNPEDALLLKGRRAFRWAMLKVFEELETAVASGRIRAYGVASAEGFRVPGPSFHPVDEMIELGEHAGGSSHHFAAIQLPFSLARLEAVFSACHRFGNRRIPAAAAAQAYGLATIGSAALNQMRLPLQALRGVGALCRDLDRPAQVALNFARSVPGLDSVLFGTSNPAHVTDALDVLALPPLDLTRQSF